jgi:hypothetical protein
VLTWTHNCPSLCLCLKDKDDDGWADRWQRAVGVYIYIYMPAAHLFGPECLHFVAVLLCNLGDFWLWKLYCVCRIHDNNLVAVVWFKTPEICFNSRLPSLARSPRHFIPISHPSSSAPVSYFNSPRGSRARHPSLPQYRLYSSPVFTARPPCNRTAVQFSVRACSAEVGSMWRWRCPVVLAVWAVRV